MKVKKNTEKDIEEHYIYAILTETEKGRTQVKVETNFEMDCLRNITKVTRVLRRKINNANILHFDLTKCVDAVYYLGENKKVYFDKEGYYIRIVK